MDLFFSDFLFDRIEEILQDLLETNVEYVSSLEKIKTFYDILYPSSEKEKGTMLVPDDLKIFENLLNAETASAAIIQEELYKQGYIDCVKMLKTIGVLA